MLIEVKSTKPPDYRSLRPAQVREARRQFQNALLLAKAIATREAPVGVSGNLRRSIRLDMPRETAGGLVGRMFVDAPANRYAQFVEFGRGPGRMPPFSPGTDLWLWVKRKLAPPEEELRSAAFLLARAIGAQGTRPHPFFGPAGDAVERRLPGIAVEVAKAGAKDFQTSSRRLS